jgi:hypothetical protein
LTAGKIVPILMVFCALADLDAAVAASSAKPITATVRYSGESRFRMLILPIPISVAKAIWDPLRGQLLLELGSVGCISDPNIDIWDPTN